MDFSGARPPVDQVDYIFRYLSRSGGPKVLTADEAHGYIAKGKAVVLNFEDAADNALRGAAQGASDAVFANDLADKLGAPSDAWIFYSCDTAATTQQVQPYYQAAHNVGRRPVAYYGGLGVGMDLKRAGIVAGVWCANAASWSGFRTWEAMAAVARTQAHVLQHVDHPLQGIPPSAYDYNEVLIPFPCWGRSVAPGPGPGPTQGEDEMAIVPRRVASSVQGRVAFIDFRPAQAALVAYNGADFAPANGFNVTRGFGIVSATLTVAHKGNLKAAELPDGTGVVLTADGDGGTFAIKYAHVGADPYTQ
jgi:hypothetical protein